MEIALQLNEYIPEVDTDPRELERFAEHFKQRRIKLGVTQVRVSTIAEVGCLDEFPWRILINI